MTVNDEGGRAVFQEVVGISNSPTAGICNQVYCLAFNTTTSGSTLVTLLSEANTMATNYRQFILNKLTVEWVPYVSNTNGGQVAIGVDPEPLSNLPGSLQNVNRHRGSVFTDIQALGKTSMYMSKWEQNPPKKVLAGVAGTRTEDDVSTGCLQIYSSNTLAAGALIGSIKVVGDFTFLGRR